MESQLINIIINGGAVGLAVLTLGILYKILGNHLHHLTEAINKNTVVLEKLHQLIKDKL